MIMNYNLQILDTLNLFNHYSKYKFFHIKNDSLWIINEGNLFFKEGDSEDLMIYSDLYFLTFNSSK